MSELQRILEKKRAETLERRRPTIPKGWEPGIRFDPKTGEGVATIPAPGRDESFDDVLKRRFPDVPVEALEVLEMRSWDSGHHTQEHVRVRVRQPGEGPVSLDVEPLLKRIRSHKGRCYTDPRKQADSSLAVVLTDWQLGLDFEDGGGPEATIDRLVNQVGQVQDLVRDLKAQGRAPKHLDLVSLGDLIEQCDGFYPAQAFTTTLGLTEQLDAALEMWLRFVRELGPYFDSVYITGVASNHGEVRKNGRKATTDSDSFDLHLLNTVSKVLSANDEAYGFVTVEHPSDPLVAQVERHGHRLGFIHGHQVPKPGAWPSHAVWKWWEKQAFAGLLDVDTLVSGHFHHPWWLSQAGRTTVGAPANDGGSRWLTTTSGLHAKPGLLTFEVSNAGPDHFLLHRGE